VIEHRDVHDNNQPPIPSHLFEEIDQLPKIEFNATAYAILEAQQAVEIKVQRTGPIDVVARFRCLPSLSHTFMHAYAMMQNDTS
jgi:hypothetical protein